MTGNFAITIGRQLGSGGREIGKKIAEELGIAFYDKELLQIASRESGLGKEFFEEMDEKKSHSIFGGLLNLQNTFSDEFYTNYYLSNETLFKIQSDVIRNLAERESCLFLGRCADYVLKDSPRCLNVFISADPEERIRRTAALRQVSETKAREIIIKTDKKRAEYYRFYSNKTWGAAESYHLCINSSVLGIEETAAFLLRFIRQKFGL
ncbi:MAG TPA: cytidylate kinase-like family protein [Prolixibacteraceae bacterium]|jgi:cytidylate kinase|nr:cytidylate kinase-like family protein [Prolixibacteraceae bacterium]